MLLQINLSQNTRSGVTYYDHKDKIKAISQIDHSYLGSTKHISPTFQIFCCKIEIADEID